MEKERFTELAFQYFLNQIEPEDYTDLKNALDSRDEELNKIFLDVKKIVLQLPFASGMIEPSPAVKEKILNEIRLSADKKIHHDIMEKQKGFVERLAGYLWLNKPGFALGLTLILIIAIVFLLMYTSDLNDSIRNRQNQITLLQDELVKNKELLSILASKEIEIVVMNGLKVNPAGYGKIIWDPGRKKAILQISNLPVVPEDKDYQLWVIKDNKPVSAGVFDVYPENENFYKIENLAEVNKNLINAFAVTLEPKGGVPQPTGEMYLLGKPAL